MNQALHRARRSFNKLLASQERRAFTFTPPIALFLLVPFFLAGNPFEDLGAYMQGLVQGLILMLLMSPFVLFSAYIIVGVFYLPFHDLFRRFNHRSLPAVLAAVVAVSTILYTLPEFYIFLDDGTSYADCFSVNDDHRTPCDWTEFWNGIALWTIYSAVVAAVFWFIYAGGWRLRIGPDEPWT